MKNFDERTKVLHGQGKKLVAQNHFDSNFIKRSVAEILQYQEKVFDLTRGREIYLNHMKTSLEFQRDVIEVENWMNDKMDKFSKASKEYEQGSLTEKIKFLQKYTVFENEVSKHQVIIDGIVTKGELLINSNHNVEDTKAKLKSLLKLWSELKALSEQIGQELQEALDLYNFETEIDEIEQIVREKEYMSSVSDTGKDLEHCKDLLHKLSETDAEMNVNEKFSRVETLSKKVFKTEADNDIDNNKESLEKLQRVTKKWNSIQDCIENYRKTLNEALIAHQLNSDIMDLIDIITEKKTALAFDAKALANVTADTYYQKCLTIQDFIKTLEPKIKDFQARCSTIVSKNHPQSEKVQSTQETLKEEWQSCLKFSISQLELVTRHEELTKSMKVINDQKNALQTSLDAMNATVFPAEVAEVEVALARHADMKSSLQIQNDILKSSMSKLQESDDDFDGESVYEQMLLKQKEELAKVQALAENCESKWNEVNTKLHQCKDYLNVNLKLAEIIAWVESAETFLKVDDGVTTTADIDVLLTKQNTFERSLQQQQKAFVGIREEGENLIADANFKKDVIAGNLAQCALGLQNLQDANR